MELHQVRYVVAVADHGTFTAAARACFVAQPSLSQAVRALERELGVDLFHRVGRAVRLTAAGEAFVPAGRAALRALDAVRAEVGAVAGVLAGHLDLVALPTLAVDPVTALVGSFRRAHPTVTVRLAHPSSTRELVDWVGSGRSEVGITELPAATDRLVTRALRRQELVAVLPPGATAGSALDLAELARFPLVTQPTGTSVRDTLDASFAAGGLTPEVAVETDLREAIVPLVLTGAGAAVLPRPMAELAARQGATIAALRPALWRKLGLVHRDAPLSPAAAAFVAIALPVRSRGRR